MRFIDYVWILLTRKDVAKLHVNITKPIHARIDSKPSPDALRDNYAVASRAAIETSLRCLREKQQELDEQKHQCEPSAVDRPTVDVLEVGSILLALPAGEFLLVECGERLQIP